jgi:hypothetical protein
MTDTLKDQIFHGDSGPATYYPEAAVWYLTQEGRSAITVFIRRGDTRDSVVRVLSSAGLQVEVSEPWITLTEKPGTMGLSVRKIGN